MYKFRVDDQLKKDDILVIIRLIRKLLDCSTKIDGDSIEIYPFTTRSQAISGMKKIIFQNANSLNDTKSTDETVEKINLLECIVASGTILNITFLNNFSDFEEKCILEVLDIFGIKKTTI